MKRILLFAMLASLSIVGRAQFFDFGFPGPYTQRRQVQQDPITPPEYKGGMDKLNKFLTKNFITPHDRVDVNGQVVVACIVGTKGKVIDAQVVRGLNRDLNDEALRVARKLKFKPAKQGKKKVKSRFDVVFPIRHGQLSFFDFPTQEV